MTPEEVPPPSDSAADPSKPRRRSRRGGRGRRRRPAPGAAAPLPPGSAPAPHDAARDDRDDRDERDERHDGPPDEVTADAAPGPESEIHDTHSEPEAVDFDERAPREFDAAPADSPDPAEPFDRDEPVYRDEEAPGRPESFPPVAPAEPREFRPATPASVTEAIEEVNRVIASLRQVLDTMEEILETLELAEVQKNADEREIQALRSAMKNFDRPTDARREPRRGDDRDRRRGRR